MEGERNEGIVKEGKEVINKNRKRQRSSSYRLCKRQEERNEGEPEGREGGIRV